MKRAHGQSAVDTLMGTGSELKTELTKERTSKPGKLPTYEHVGDSKPEQITILVSPIDRIALEKVRTERLAAGAAREASNVSALVREALRSYYKKVYEQ